MSHSPLLNLPGPAQDLLDDIDGALAQAREFVEGFNPELVVVFAPDHYNGFFYKLMPPFCIGTEAQGVGDYGTHKGPLDVPEATAVACAKAVLSAGVDIAISASMDVDHGTVQPLEKLFGRATARPARATCTRNPSTRIFICTPVRAPATTSSRNTWKADAALNSRPLAI